MAKKHRLSKIEIQQKLEEAILAQHEIATQTDEKGRSTNAANALSGLIKTYESVIGFEAGEKEVEKMKVVGGKRF